MFFRFHLYYTMLWVPFLISLLFFKKEEAAFQKLSKGLRVYFRLFPYLCMLLIWLYPFLNAEMFTDSPEAFVRRMGFLLIGATFVNALIFLLRNKPNPPHWITGLLLGCYLVLMAVWNIYVHSSMFDFVIHIMLAVVAMLPLSLLAFGVSKLAVVKAKEHTI